MSVLAEGVCIDSGQIQLTAAGRDGYLINIIPQFFEKPVFCLKEITAFGKPGFRKAQHTPQRIVITQPHERIVVVILCPNTVRHGNKAVYAGRSPAARPVVRISSIFGKGAQVGKIICAHLFPTIVIYFVNMSDCVR